MTNPHALERNFAPDLPLRIRHRPTSACAGRTACSLPRLVPLSRVVQNGGMGARP